MSIHPTVRVHDRAIVDDSEIGAGTRVWAFAHVMAGARIGERCNIGEGVFIESGVRMGDDCTIKNGISVYEGVTLGNRVFVGPNAVFTNVDRPRAGRRVLGTSGYRLTNVADGATIGANATIRCGVNIGRSAFIGAGTVVVKDVPAYALVVGNPAKQRGWVCECGASLDKELLCQECGEAYELDAPGLRKRVDGGPPGR